MQRIRQLALIVVLSGMVFGGCAGERAAKDTISAPAPIIEKEAGSTPVPAPAEGGPTGASPEDTLAVVAGAASKPSTKKVPVIGDCYDLRPAGKTGKKRAGKSGGRCEPQSLPYARCRSGIMSCRNGPENSPVTWFSCEKKNSNTSDEPLPGSVLILGVDRGHRMPTGHVAYVEDVIPVGPSSYRLILSHTNYDRKCSLETRIETLYHRETQTLDVLSGAWKSWGRRLKVAGFILE